MDPSQNILAFWTITTTLCVLHDSPTNHKPDTFLRNTGHSKPLLILNAISSLLISRRYEVVLVASTVNRVEACLTTAVCNWTTIIYKKLTFIAWILGNINIFWLLFHLLKWKNSTFINLFYLLSILYDVQILYNDLLTVISNIPLLRPLQRNIPKMHT